MAQYHGDLHSYQGNFYKSRSDKNLFIAIAILLFAGFTGAHRFYLGHMKLGWFHLAICFLAIFFGLMTFNLWLAAYLFMFQAPILFVELIVLIVRAVIEHTG